MQEKFLSSLVGIKHALRKRKKKESCHFKAGNGLVALSLTDPMLLPFPSPHLGTSSDGDPNMSLLRKRR